MEHFITNEGLVLETNIKWGTFLKTLGFHPDKLHFQPLRSKPKLHLRCSFRLRIRASISAFPRSLQFEEMTGAKIVGSIAGAFVIAFACDYIIADTKIFGGTTPSTVSNKEWWEETDKKFQAWPRTAGPPVVMNPISRQNFIVKSRAES
ncbi:hypothetical protein L1987_64210 [Smallanthus sonchifolius]|uniref:Uncharacterized protein n=1 Tax=Smallanthus sonchifolius TaxID=185202 RepID=A0ACB9CFF4_9ASTR|nr:hypothetical protein L1987_64210 [Smallanthus sonchifolius]